MSEPIPTEDASRKLAEAVFADPEQSERFKQMRKDTASREAVPDDFGWLPSHSDEFATFESFARRLLAVPKSEIDAERAKGR